jgi:hypothetical protein
MYLWNDSCYTFFSSCFVFILYFMIIFVPATKRKSFDSETEPVGLEEVERAGNGKHSFISKPQTIFRGWSRGSHPRA